MKPSLGRPSKPKPTTPRPSPSAETRELTEIRERVNVGAYVGAAIEGRGIAGGAELEYNQALGVPGDRFPMRLLEDRAKIDGDAASGQRPWVDRVFGESAAARVGVGFQSVAPGIVSVPVTTAGAAGAQRGAGSGGKQRSLHGRRDGAEAEAQRGTHGHERRG